jgi:hypothetical protein
LVVRTPYGPSLEILALATKFAHRSSTVVVYRAMIHHECIISQIQQAARLPGSRDL